MQQCCIKFKLITIKIFNVIIYYQVYIHKKHIDNISNYRHEIQQGIKTKYKFLFLEMKVNEIFHLKSKLTK